MAFSPLSLRILRFQTGIFLLSASPTSQSQAKASKSCSGPHMAEWLRAQCWDLRGSLFPWGTMAQVSWRRPKQLQKREKGLTIERKNLYWRMVEKRPRRNIWKNTSLLSLNWSIGLTLQKVLLQFYLLYFLLQKTQSLLLWGIKMSAPTPTPPCIWPSFIYPVLAGRMLGLMAGFRLLDCTHTSFYFPWDMKRDQKFLKNRKYIWFSLLSFSLPKWFLNSNFLLLLLKEWNS